MKKSNQPKIDELIEKFSSGNQIDFGELDNGIVLIKIDNAFATATISLYGGHIVGWQPKSQKNPVLWRSDLVQFKSGKAIRAGVPICWPWFGAHPVYADSPAHGYARISQWALQSVSTNICGETEICMTMNDSELNLSTLGLAANLSVCISIGEKLTIDLQTHNIGNQPINFTEALHAYFYISDISQVKIDGLNNVEYVDLIDNQKHKLQSGLISFNCELGRVYLNTTSDCRIEDPDFQRTIHIIKNGSQSTVVWNPWEDTAKKMDDLGSMGWKTMVCIESANALTNTVHVKPGEYHNLSVTYSVIETKRAQIQA